GQGSPGTFTSTWSRDGMGTPTSCRSSASPACCPNRWAKPGHGSRARSCAAQEARHLVPARRRVDPVRMLVWGLGVLVAALVLSWAYAAFLPKAEIRAGGAEGRLIRVQVLNGTREGGIGARVAHHLRDGGFQVVEVGNADRSDYVASLVVARRDDLATATA